IFVQHFSYSQLIWQNVDSLFQPFNAVEALNLDGGGSSCLLINGRETIKVSDKSQRAVPAVFLIQKKL
ncbi:MAG: phosphodiester glycosidase family protein, partial [Ferruginibacter sp.]